MDRIKNEPYFRWPNKMGGDLSKRNQNSYCTYHRDKRHTTEQCRVLKDHLEQLIKVGYLKEFVVDPRNQEAGQGTWPRGNPFHPFGSDRGHPCNFNGYLSDQEERGTSSGSSGKLSR